MSLGAKLRAGVIGLGRHGFRHLKAYELLDETQIVAVCDVRPESVKAALDQYKDATGYTDWRLMLEEERLDILSVVTNGPTHAPITIAAAGRGIRRILCEKPMATSSADAREMIRVCRAHNARLAVAHSRRWIPAYQRLRELLAAGLIGRLCHFWVTCGGGLFAGNGTHFLDLARMLCGADAVQVVGSLDQTGTPNPRGSQFQDPGAIALYFFRNGMRAVIDMYEDVGVPQRIEIVGSSGRVLIDEMEARWEITTRDEEAKSQPLAQSWWLPLRPFPFEPAALDMIEMMVSGLKELLGDGDLSCTGEDGLASLEMVIGAHVSSKRGRLPIALPLAEDFRQIDIPFT